MTTGIQWTDETWNPTRGCSRVSPGCDNCYAMGQAHRFSGKDGPYEGLTTLRKRGVDWTGVARFHPEMLAQPLKWKKPRRVFVNSMSDLFHSSLSNEEIAAVFGVMAACPQHTFQVLTKRPDRMLEWFDWLEEFAHSDKRTGAPAPLVGYLYEFAIKASFGSVNGFRDLFPPWPLPNVWLGVSCEDQQRANERIHLLLQCPAAVRFVSAEPLLGQIDLTRTEYSRCYGSGLLNAVTGRKSTHPVKSLEGLERDQELGRVPRLDWVIVGGESGPKARPCATEWIEGIVEQCTTAGVACFVKQLGSYIVSESRSCDTDEEAARDFGFKSRWLWRARLNDKKGGDINEWPESLQVREFPGAK